MMLRVSGTGAGSRDNYRRPFKLHWTFLSDEQRIEPSKTSDALSSPAWRTPWTVLGRIVKDWNFGLYTNFGSTDKVKQHNHKLLWNVAVQSQFGRYGSYRSNVRSACNASYCSAKQFKCIALWKIAVPKMRLVLWGPSIFNAVWLSAIHSHAIDWEDDEVGMVETKYQHVFHHKMQGIQIQIISIRKMGFVLWGPSISMQCTCIAM